MFGRKPRERLYSPWYPDLSFRAIFACLFGVVLPLLTLKGAQPPWLVWNVSSSAPTGLYVVGERKGLGRGDMVVATLPAASRHFAAVRGYLPMNVPLVKRVAAVPGDRVCAYEEYVGVNGRRVAARLPADARGRTLPRWGGCEWLGEGRYLLLMADNPASFDGRYFGISDADDIIGKARLLWRR